VSVDPRDPIPRSVDAIDWASWQPTDRATLVFVVRRDEILLIRKKRGLGAGKINGPGGKIEPGEAPDVCAARELHEELCVKPLGLGVCGELDFQFVDGYGIHVTVFRAEDCVGDATETDEAVPRWTSLDRIPYEEMWEDDRLWLPAMLEGQSFRGRFIFEGDRLLDHRLEVGGAATAWSD
jgi:8-oxo-dGTP diphosphatase